MSEKQDLKESILSFYHDCPEQGTPEVIAAVRVAIAAGRYYSPSPVSHVNPECGCLVGLSYLASGFDAVQTRTCYNNLTWYKFEGMICAVKIGETPDTNERLALLDRVLAELEAERSIS